MHELLHSGKPEPVTDKDGRFRMPKSRPGTKFKLFLNLDGKALYAKLTWEQHTLQPGQDLDLGDVRCSRAAESGDCQRKMIPRNGRRSALIDRRERTLKKETSTPRAGSPQSATKY